MVDRKRENGHGLAKRCEDFKVGAMTLYDDKTGPMYGDMWLFELYHHLTDCALALKTAQEKP